MMTKMPELVPTQIMRIGEVVQESVKGARQADEQARDHPAHPDMPVHGNAEEIGTPLVLANSEQRPSERRVQQRRHNGDGDRETAQHEIVKDLVITGDVQPGKTEVDGQTVPAGQAIVAAGYRIPAEGDVVEHLAERDGDHGKINAAQANDQQRGSAASPT